MTQKKRLGLSIPEKLYQKIKTKADYQGRTINSMCLEMLWKHFDKEDETTKN